MCTFSARPFWLSVAFALGLWIPSGAGGADDPAQTPVEVHEWSVWVGNPAQATVNAARVFRNAMPDSVGTIRPKFDDKEPGRKFPIAPVSVIQFFGQPHRDVDVEIRAKKGSFLSHWPPGTERGGRLQWFKVDLVTSPPPGIVPGHFTANHWFQTLRDAGSALFLTRETQVDRFIAYDTEITIPLPLKIRGGPDEYTLQNLTDRKLLDVAVIAPNDKGFRVGWLDDLPTAVPAQDEGARKKDEAAAKKTDQQKAEGVFHDAAAPGVGDDAPPLPAEGDATVRARLDQVLNRPVTVAVENVARKAVLEAIAGQARLRLELDVRTIAKAGTDLGQTTSLKAAGVSARDALADVLGTVGLSYRITDDGTLFITTAARLAEGSAKTRTVLEGPPVKLTLSQPLKPADPSYRELTHDAYTRRLLARGLRDDVVQTLLARYGQALFEPGELIVLSHFSREALDETVLLDVFPPPRKLVRSALLVVYGVDPRLQDRARVLVQQLGDRAPEARETAEARLFEMGPVALPALEDALTSKDVEIVYRAERLLLRLNRPVQ